MTRDRAIYRKPIIQSFEEQESVKVSFPFQLVFIKNKFYTLRINREEKLDVDRGFVVLL